MGTVKMTNETARKNIQRRIFIEDIANKDDARIFLANLEVEGKDVNDWLQRVIDRAKELRE